MLDKDRRRGALCRSGKRRGGGRVGEVVGSSFGGSFSKLHKTRKPFQKVFESKTTSENLSYFPNLHSENLCFSPSDIPRAR